MLEKYKKIINCFILLIVFFVLTIAIRSYFKPFFIIVFMIFICNPLSNFMLKHKIFTKKVSAIISIVLVNLIIFFTVYLIGNYLLSKFNIFIDTGYKALKNNIVEVLEKISNITNIKITTESIKNSSFKLINGNYIKKGAVYTTEGIVSYMLSNMAVYFILVDKELLTNFLAKLVNSDNVILIKKKYNDINELLKIELVLILISTIETILGFYALSIENALILGIACGILDLLPYIGIVFVFVPLIILKFYAGQYIIVGGLICLYILLTISRQIMETRFVSNKLKIHPLPLLLSMYIGINLFGIIGVFVGPMYVITAKEIIMS